MSLYKQFKTDASVEKQGILLDYGKNSKGENIMIRVARAGGSNMKFAKLMEQRVKPYRRQIQNETLSDDVADRIAKEVYAESVVLGWENVEDEQGKAMAFNVANCIKLFNDLPDLYADIQTQAQRAALFRAEILEEDLKNS